jgi:hypothetical protein
MALVEPVETAHVASRIDAAKMHGVHAVGLVNRVCGIMELRGCCYHVAIGAAWRDLTEWGLCDFDEHRLTSRTS